MIPHECNLLTCKTASCGGGHVVTVAAGRCSEADGVSYTNTVLHLLLRKSLMAARILRLSSKSVLPSSWK